MTEDCYETKPATILRLHESIAAEGYHSHLAHHEIYLSDPNRTRPAMLRTILRQPMAH